MNAIMFGTKRAFHGFLRVTRKPLVGLGLTAARFDMMSVLLRGGRVWQSKLRKRLGVTASVVTRMLKALEALGLVRRKREQYGDRRQIAVRLTDEGKRRIVGARRALIRAIRRLVCFVISFGRYRDVRDCVLPMATLEEYLDALRRAFGDTARLYYPWGHPDD